MSRKSVSRKSSRSPVPTMEESNLDEQRLDLNNILQINPWKDVDKYDKQEVGQIQEILVQFNTMVIEDKKNKRRSVRKSRTPTLDTKAPTGNEALEEASMRKNDNKQRSKSESSMSITIQENVMTDKTNSIRNANKKPLEEPEEHPEEKKGNSSRKAVFWKVTAGKYFDSKLKNHMKLNVPVEDKKNKRKSVEKRRASTSPLKTTNNPDLEVEMTENKIIRSNKRKSCIGGSNIDMLKNLSIGNTIDSKNIERKTMEEDEDHPEEKKEQSSKSKNLIELSVPLDDKKNKRKSVEKRRVLTPSSKATNTEDLEVETTKNKMMRSDKRKSYISESSIDMLKNLSIENLIDNQNIEEKPVEEDEDDPEEKKKKSSKLKNHIELNVPLDDKKNKRKSVEKRRASTSSSKATNNADLEVETTKNEMIRNDKRKSCINESSIDISKNVSTENTSDNKNIDRELVEEYEGHPEEEKEKSSKSIYSVELYEQLNDKNNKRKSVGKHQASTNNTDLEVETTKNKMIRNNKRKSCINESSIDISKNVSTENTSDNKNIDRELVEEYEGHPEEEKEKSSKSIYSVELYEQLNDKNNKRKSVGKHQASTNNADLEVETTKNEMIRNDKRKSCINESSIDISKNVSTENTSDNKNIDREPVKEYEGHPEEEKEKSSKSIYSVELYEQLNDKNNKRKSVGKHQASTNNTDLEVETTKNEMIRNDKRKSCINESSIDISKNVSTENTSDNKNIDREPVKEYEGHPEEEKEKSSKSIYSVELYEQLNDKNNKRKSVGKHQASTNNTDLEVETKKNKMIRNDKRKSCINKSSIDVPKNISTDNTSDNKNIEEKPMEKDEDDPEEKKKKSSKPIHPLELDVQLDDIKNKRKSISKRRTSISSSKATGSNADLEDKTKKKNKMRNDATQHWISKSSVNDAIINGLENVATENSSNNQSTVNKERKVMREENKDLSFKIINHGQQSSVEKRLISSSRMKTIASNNATEGQSTLTKEKFQYWLITFDEAGSIIDPEKNIDLGHKRNNISIESYEEEIIATQKLEKIRDETINEAVTEKIVDVYETFTVELPQISGSVSPTMTHDKLSYVEAIENPSDEPSCGDDFVDNGSIVSDHLTYENFQIFSSTQKLEMLDCESENRQNNDLQKDDYSTKQSLTMKPRSVSAEPEKKNFAEKSDKKYESKNTLDPDSDKTKVLNKAAELSVKQSSTVIARSDHSAPNSEKFPEYNNNGFESKHGRKREKKIAQAFEKFGKKFVKYSSRIEHTHKYKIGSIDVTVDSESDSYSSDNSSSSSSSGSSNSSSDSDESSSSESTSSSSICSCCSRSSSDSSYTSYSGSTSCDCSGCCDYNYLEYTLASSSSTHPGSDDSTDSSTD